MPHCTRSSIASLYNLKKPVLEKVRLSIGGGEGACHLLTRRPGAKIGGTAIDRALHVLMAETFGDGFGILPIQQTAAGSVFMEQFEKTKRNYQGSTKSKPVFGLPLHMKTLEEGNGNEHVRYDAEAREVRISRYVV